MTYEQGSLWNRWDLHVHTPASIVATTYGAEGDEVWETYIKALEALPSTFKVLGINDYIFLEGYTRLLAEKNSGRLRNIDLLLPVIELRLDKFGGSDSKLSRVNYHVIFSEEVKPEIIQHQFINALSKAYVISPHYAALQKRWDGVFTKESLMELGTLIIESVPQKERKNFNSPLVEGFNNLNVSLQDVNALLKKPYFDKKHLSGVGKTEWWDIRWNDKSIAEKKNIIHSAHLVFTAAEDPKSFNKSRDALTQSGVNNHLFDCSDAHAYADSTYKDRLGNCFTWINADPTFRGLVHALVEYDDRVFVGKTPPLLDKVSANQTKYIRGLRIFKSRGAKTKSNWFKTNISFNPGLAAIIGNKGSGKSALADVIGLLSNTSHAQHFSFLSKDKFKRQPENLAAQFEAELEWTNGTIVPGTLDQTVDATEVEKSNYIPQGYFEEVTNDLGNIEESTFDKEIKKVIFSHVPSDERLEYASLGELIEFKTSSYWDRINSHKNQLQRINKEIYSLEKKLLPEYKRQLEKSLASKLEEIKTYKTGKPQAVAKPKSQSQKTAEAGLKLAQEKRDGLAKQLDVARRDLGTTNKKLSKAESLREKIETFKEQFDAFGQEIEPLVTELGLKEVIFLQIEPKPLDQLITRLNTKKRELTNDLDPDRERSKASLFAYWQDQVKVNQKALKKPMQKYQAYVEDAREWQKGLDALIGEKKEEGTQKYFQARLAEILKIPDQLAPLFVKRSNWMGKIYKDLVAIKMAYAKLYEPVQHFIEQHPDIGNKISLSFDVSILNVGFEERFFEIISRQKGGSFSGSAVAHELIETLLAAYDYNREEDILKFITEIVEKLQHKSSAPKPKGLRIENQMRAGYTVEDLYNFLFALSYLKPRYVLKMGDKELAQLSPGERGALLLVFYLLVDKDNAPLVVDQPEHNLDNQTIYELLVPAIKKSKKNRQIVIITHSPNLAVVCDADQIIWADLDIADGYKVSYQSGSLENPTANKKVVEILEGTWGAFLNRSEKYFQPE